jgi:hypothetical protein
MNLLTYTIGDWEVIQTRHGYAPHPWMVTFRGEDRIGRAGLQYTLQHELPQVFLPAIERIREIETA